MGNNKLLDHTWAENNKNRDNEHRFGSASYDTETIFVNNVGDVTEELFDLLITKHHDYGPKNISESPGGPLNGLRVRLWDKLARLNNLVDNGADPEHESLEDTFKDMANYAIIGLLVLRGKWDGE